MKLLTFRPPLRHAGRICFCFFFSFFFRPLQVLGRRRRVHGTATLAGPIFHSVPRRRCRCGRCCCCRCVFFSSSSGFQFFVQFSHRTDHTSEQQSRLAATVVEPRWFTCLVSFVFFAFFFCFFIAFLFFILPHRQQKNKKNQRRDAGEKKKKKEKEKS